MPLIDLWHTSMVVVIRKGLLIDSTMKCCNCPIDVDCLQIGMTPLGAASWKGHSEVVCLLLAAPGVDINAADEVSASRILTPSLLLVVACVYLSFPLV
jgi:Ankyrin repeats (many copies)